MKTGKKVTNAAKSNSKLKFKLKKNRVDEEEKKEDVDSPSQSDNDEDGKDDATSSLKNEDSKVIEEDFIESEEEPEHDMQNGGENGVEESESEEELPVFVEEKTKEKAKAKGRGTPKKSAVAPEKSTKNAKSKKSGESKEEGDYEVEQIVDMEVNMRKSCPVKFRLRWSGYGEKDDTWQFKSLLDCDDLIADFLEISGRKTEFERAMEKKAEQEADVVIRSSSRRVAIASFKASYSELDEDQEEIIPSGTRTRKPKRRHESDPNLVKKPSGRPKKNSPAKAKVESEEEENFEVEKIVGHQERGGEMTYKVRWVGYKSKDDTWLPEDELSCGDVLKKYKEAKNIADKQPDDWVVERIIKHREHSGKLEYLVHWTGFSNDYDTWEPKDNLEGCPSIVSQYNKKKSITTKPSGKSKGFQERKGRPATKSKTKSPYKKKRSINQTTSSDDESDPDNDQKKRGNYDEEGDDSDFEDFEPKAKVELTEEELEAKLIKKETAKKEKEEKQLKRQEKLKNKKQRVVKEKKPEVTVKSRSRRVSSMNVSYSANENEDGNME